MPQKKAGVNFRYELNRLDADVIQTSDSPDISLDQGVESAAWKSLGKTTIKHRKNEIFSNDVKRQEKRQIKKQLKSGPDLNTANIT